MMTLPGGLGLCTGVLRAAAHPAYLVVAAAVLVVALLPARLVPVTLPLQVFGASVVLHEVPGAKSVLGGVGVLLLFLSWSVNALVWLQARLSLEGAA
jgi:hypothetical protein